VLNFHQHCKLPLQCCSQRIVITNCWQFLYSSQVEHTHKVVPAFTVQHYIANKYYLLIGLENSRDQCFKTKTSGTKTKTAEFRSRDKDRSLEDYKTATAESCILLRRASCLDTDSSCLRSWSSCICACQHITSACQHTQLAYRQLYCYRPQSTYKLPISSIR